jgi:hypothetical protein
MSSPAKKPCWLFRLTCRLARRFYPHFQNQGTENLPDEPCIIVGNHAQTNGPVYCELYYPRPQRTWCAHQMMSLREVPAYAYADFWGEKPRYIRWLFKLISYLIAPLAAVLFNNAHTLAVYRDKRIIGTFRATVQALQKGEDIIIFPESPEPHNHVVYTFQERFVDVARLYHKRTGKALSFVPMYIAPNLQMTCFGQAIRFDPDAPIEQERTRICRALMQSITDLATALPEHTVIPYKNIPKKDFPSNLPSKRG